MYAMSLSLSSGILSLLYKTFITEIISRSSGEALLIKLIALLIAFKPSPIGSSGIPEYRLFGFGPIACAIPQ